MMKRMIWVKRIGLLILSMCLMTGCSSQSKSAFALSDLGGVYSVEEKDVDFSVEVSGHLSEDSEAIEETEPSVDPDSLQALNNTIRCWGIARSPGNQTPRADPGAPELLEKYGGLYIADTEQKTVYLTFDEGYENGYTGKILDVLRDNQAQAVFFITGPYLNQHQDLVRRMVEEGHVVGNHTIHHPSLPSLDDRQLEEELLGLDRVFQEKFGKNMKYLRPPKGEYSERTLQISRELGYRNMFWSFAYDDWYRDKIRGPQYAYDIVMRNLHNGAILLLHAVSKDNAEALDSIIKGIREKGYEIGSVNNIP